MNSRQSRYSKEEKVVLPASLTNQEEEFIPKGGDDSPTRKLSCHPSADENERLPLVHFTADERMKPASEKARSDEKARSFSRLIRYNSSLTEGTEGKLFRYPAYPA